jgi:hypothetical protein
MKPKEFYQATLIEPLFGNVDALKRLACKKKLNKIFITFKDVWITGRVNGRDNQIQVWKQRMGNCSQKS